MRYTAPPADLGEPDAISRFHLALWLDHVSAVWTGRPTDPIELSPGGYGEPPAALAHVEPSDRFHPDLPDREPSVFEAELLLKQAIRDFDGVEL